ncbi:MAG: ferredoxin--NADP reductase [Bacteroidetes bacterium]|nr:ferredoxin--NADP reductase [Bacteroidota bacterium]MBU1372641.1 ferredoxin--NADP reductase [Bacteroidota bacterium]MBU1484837.1 ferredoxin--NADP reductase [Bacteroidota bacterium]MBU1761605.1 ferredoxin--NADP reductase [Bacteroidota bacterium]MBU2376194.1 ferredoxin--NADP reductase [Bacteroidota bacterium]
MTDFSFLQISNYLGLLATGVLTFNFLFGMLLGTGYRSHNFWQRLPDSIKNLNIYNLHNLTAYVALALVVLHPLLLLFDSATKFKFIDIVFPINAPHQKLYVAFGTLAMFAIITIIITTQKVVKKKMSFRTWKNIHLISYVTALLFIIHGIAIDPQLKDRPVDIFDAEKIVSELCLLILITATIFRIRYAVKIRRTTKKFHSVTIAQVIEETIDAKTFVFEIPSKLKKNFAFTSGQFIIIKSLINDKEYKRAYSLSVSPYTNEKHQITVKRIQNGIVSNHLNDTLKKDDKILVFPPSGEFFEELKSNLSNYLFFAGGSGITPIYSIIKTLLNKDSNCLLKLIYANRNENSIIFKNELEKLEQQYPNKFRVTHVLSEASGGWNGMKGRLDKDKMKEFLSNIHNYPIDQTEYYICGPSPFMELVEYELLNHRIPADQINLERFISIGDTEESLEVGNATAETNSGLKKVYATVEGIKNTVVCEENQNILDALLKAGIDAPYSCREGVCSTCLAKLISGKVKMKNYASLTDIDISENNVLTCQAIPLTSETEIKYDNQ